MKVVQTAISDVRVFEPSVYEDERGFFFEPWNAATFRNVGLDVVFVQDNHSRSNKDVLRGLHYQLDRPQGKLARVVSGRAFVAVVDVRKSSPTFGRSVTIILSGENKLLIWIPPGFAHGFLSLENDTDFLYKCTDFYAPQHERTILWCDPEVEIPWPLNGRSPNLSLKDRGGVPLAQAETYP